MALPQLSLPLFFAYIRAMRATVDPRDKTELTDQPSEAGYAAWKRAKIERGLVQSKDRAAMIPVEQILRDLKA